MSLSSSLAAPPRAADRKPCKPDTPVPFQASSQCRSSRTCARIGSRFCPPFRHSKSGTAPSPSRCFYSLTKPAPFEAVLSYSPAI